MGIYEKQTEYDKRYDQARDRAQDTPAAFVERIEKAEHDGANPVNRRVAHVMRWFGRLHCYNIAAR